MLDLTSRSREKVNTPVVEVVSIEATGTYQPSAADAAPLPAIKTMLEKRLEIARSGLHEAQLLLRAGNEADARMILEKVDEDLHLLRRRVRRELEAADLVTCHP
jgi:hypothetical protein